MNIVDKKILTAFQRLKTYCEAEDFKGWDPYDGLNSRLFKALPLVGRSAICRLVWIQLFKRNPLNMRRATLVPKQHNAKGLGLFLQGYCHLWHAVDSCPELVTRLGSKAEIELRINQLANKLLEMRAPGYAGAAWGYNFPWQCRREFLFPANEPTVVATEFVAWALLDAAEITGRTDLRDVAVSSADFILKDLRRTPHKGGSIISYSRMPGNDTIYNASLLGSRLLTRIWKLTGRQDCLALAQASMTACCADQRPDGSWTYGVKPVTGWIDSFHTGYNLDGISAWRDITGDTSFNDVLDRGTRYYLETFFADDGTPSYYHDRVYPIDIHCPGQLPVTLSNLGLFHQNREKTLRVLHWTIDNMQAPEGYFYYQLKKGLNSRISYMRWSNAFMFAALAVTIRQLASFQVQIANTAQ